MLAAFALALLAALPDALLALWLKLLGDGVLARTGAAWCSAPPSASALSATATWFLRTVSDARAAALPRQGDDRARVARRPAAGVGGHHRPPRAPRLPRPAGGAARPGLRARPHVHVAVLHRRLDPAAGRHRRPADVDPPGAGAAAPLRAADGARPRPGGRRSSARPRSAGRRRAASPGTCSPPPPPRRRARRCGSPRIGRGWSSDGARPGSAGTAGRRARGGAPRSGTRSAGPSSAAAYVGAVVFVAAGPRTRRPAPCCWCSPPGRGCRPTSARRSARSASCAASGWTARAGWPGWRTTPLAVTADEDLAVPDAARHGHPPRARLVRLPRHATGWCSTTSTLTLPAGAVVAIVGENGAGKTTLVKLLCQALRARARGASSSTACRWRGCRPRHGARGWPGRSRTSSASSSPPATRSASATCRASTTSRPSSLPSAAPAPTTSCGACPAGLDTQLGPTWPGGVEVSFGQWQKLALARGFMRERAAAAGARRADRRARRRDRARPLRALRRRRPAAAATTAASPSWCRTASPPCAWPT